MAPLSHDLAGLILPHDHFGSHLNESGTTTNLDLEKLNFRKAGQILAERWNQSVIDGFPCVAEYINPPATSEDERRLVQIKIIMDEILKKLTFSLFRFSIELNLIVLFEIEFVLKKKPKKDMNFAFVHPMNITKKTLVHQEKNSLNHKNMILMNIGVRYMCYKHNILCKLFVVIRLNVVDHGALIMSTYFLIDFCPHQFHLNERHTEFEWQTRIIKEDNFMDRYFKEFNFMVLSYNIHRFRIVLDLFYC